MAEPSESHGLRELFRGHLGGLVVALVGFLAASAAVIVADAPRWARVTAAALALVSLCLLVVWLPLPWSSWRARRGARLVAVLVPAAAAAAVLALGATIWDEGRAAVATDPATMLLLDGSDSMRAHLDTGRTKFEEAVLQLGDKTRVFAHDQLGLATFGTSICDADPPSDEIVAIGPETRARIAERAAELRPGGAENLAEGAQNAIGMLGRFRGVKRIVIFAGGLDRCGDHLVDIVSEAKHQHVALDWELVGLGLTPAEKEEAQRSGVVVHFADTGDELDRTVSFVLFEEPVRRDLRSIERYVTSEIREPLNEAATALAFSSRQTARAREQLSLLEKRSKESLTRFSSVEAVGSCKALEPVIRLLRVQFHLLNEGADGLRDLVAFDESNTGELDRAQVERRNEIVDDVNAPIREYNRNVRRLPNVLETALENVSRC